MRVGVERGDRGDALEDARGLLPNRRQLLAVPAPRREELHQHHPIRVQHLGFEVVGVELEDGRAGGVEGGNRRGRDGGGDEEEGGGDRGAHGGVEKVLEGVERGGEIGRAHV